MKDLALPQAHTEGCNPQSPARHRSPFLPLLTALFGVIWLLMWVRGVGKHGFAQPSVNIFIGTDWAGLRAQVRCLRSLCRLPACGSTAAFMRTLVSTTCVCMCACARLGIAV